MEEKKSLKITLIFTICFFVFIVSFLLFIPILQKQSYLQVIANSFVHNFTCIPSSIDIGWDEKSHVPLYEGNDLYPSCILHP